MREDQPFKGGRDQPTCGLRAVRFSGLEKAKSGRPSWHLGPWGVLCGHEALGLFGPGLLGFGFQSNGLICRSLLWGCFQNRADIAADRRSLQAVQLVQVELETLKKGNRSPP